MFTRRARCRSRSSRASYLRTSGGSDGRTMLVKRNEVIMDPNRRRQGGRGRRLDGNRVPQLPWTEVTNPYAPMEVLSADQLEAIHLTSLRILEELGMEVMSPRARRRSRGGGRRGRPRRPARCASIAAWSSAHCSSAPASFVLTPRNPAKRVDPGRESHQLRTGRRTAQRA